MAAGLTHSLLLGGGSAVPGLVLGRSAAGERHAEARTTSVLGRFHELMRMRIVRGRSFEPRDAALAIPVAVVSEQLARDVFGQADPIGQVVTGDVVHNVDTGRVRAIPTATWFRVIGVVNDVAPILSDGRLEPRLYVSAHHAPLLTGLPLVLIRSPSHAGAVARDAVAAITALDPRLEVVRVQSLSDIASQLLFPRRMAVAVLTTSGCAALVLACIGLYGIASYSAAQRTKEIGIRATLGAGRRDIVALLLREGGVVTLLGTLAGAIIAAPGLRWSAVVAPYVPTLDVVSLVVAPLALVAAVLIACAIPAWRAAHLDPARILRGD
jgi:hypothetical protein